MILKYTLILGFLIASFLPAESASTSKEAETNPATGTPTEKPLIGAVSFPVPFSEQNVDEDTPGPITVTPIDYDIDAPPSGNIVFEITSSDQTIITDANLTSNHDVAGETIGLDYTLEPDANGTVTITVSALDVADNSVMGTTTFDIVVAPVNDAPTLAAIADPAAILEDAAEQTVNLSGIGDGDGGAQTLTVTATSSNPAIIPDPTVTYASPDATGSLAYTPVADASGTVTITVTVEDNGGTANGGTDSFSRTFDVAVTAVNDAPTLAAIADPAAILEDAAEQTVNLSGIGDGDGGAQTLTVTATSSNPAIIPDPTVAYASPDATGSLAYTPVADASGTVTITVTVEDNGGTANGGVNSISRTFEVTVTPVDDAPTLDGLSDLVINEDAPEQTVNLLGISDGDDGTQTLMVTATSSDPAIIPDPTVTYASPDATGSISFTPVADASGTVTITVTVEDNGGTANGGTDSFSRTFDIVVTAVNDAPVITGQVNLSINEENPLVIQLGYVNVDDPDNLNSDISLTVKNGANYTRVGNTITPVLNFVGTLTVPVFVNDGDLSSADFPLEITVNNINDKPVITGQSPDPLVTDEDAPLTITINNILGSDVDNNFPNDHSLEVLSGTNYTVTGAGEITPIANFSGSLSVRVRINDVEATNNFSDEFFLDVTVNPVNDAPIITGQSPDPLVVKENETLEILISNLDITDIEGDTPYTLEILADDLPTPKYLLDGANTIAPEEGTAGTSIDVRAQVTDINGAGATSIVANLTVYVLAPDNNIPVFTAAAQNPPTEVDQDDAYTHIFEATDADVGDVLSYYITNKPSWATFDSSTGELTGTPDNGDVGDYSGIGVTVSDGKSNVEFGPFNIEVLNVNDKPSISGTPAKSVGTGIEYRFEPLAQDPDSSVPGSTETLTFSATGIAGSWLSLDGDGVLSGIPDNPVDLGRIGPIEITVEDAAGLTATLDTFSILVVVASTNTEPTISEDPNPTPAMGAGRTFTMDEGDLFSFDADANDVDGDDLIFLITNKPSWATFDALTGELTGAPGNGDVGTFSDIEIQVTDNLSAPAKLDPITIVVNDVNVAPEISGTPRNTINENESYAFTPTATDNDIINGDNLDFSITPAIPGWMNFSAADGTLTMNPSYGIAPYSGTFTIKVEDNAGLFDELTFDLSVINVNRAPSFTTVVGDVLNEVDEDSPYSFTFEATDPDTEDVGNLSYLITNKPSWANFNSSTGLLSGTPKNGDVGVYASIIVSVTDGKAAPVALADFFIEVINTNDKPTIAGVPPTTVRESEAYDFTPTASDDDDIHGDNLTFSLVSNPDILVWADFDTSRGRLWGTPDFADQGDYEVTITVEDENNAAASLPTFTLSVIDVNRVPSIGGSPTEFAVEDNPYTFAPTASDPDNDDLTFIINNKPTWANFNTDTGELSGTPLDGDGNTTYENILISVTDGTAAPVALGSFNIQVIAVNDQPTINDIPDPSPILEDAPLQTIVISGIDDGDADENQTVTITAETDNDALIDDLVVNYTSGNNFGTIEYRPAPNQNGSATIEITVKDGGGTANSGVDTNIKEFTINVTPVNDAPTADAVSNPPAILEDSGEQVVVIGGIGDGDPEVVQNLSLSINSSNTALIPAPTFEYTANQVTIRYTPLPNANGNTTISLNISDDGGEDNGGDSLTVRSFRVSVIPVNDQPEIAEIVDTLQIDESAGLQTVVLFGIDDGDIEAVQPLNITAVSNNTGLIPNPQVAYVQGEKTANMTFTPVKGASGFAAITVTVNDNSGGNQTKQITIYVQVNPVNNQPTITAPGNLNLLEDSGEQQVTFTGVDDGDPEEAQALTITTFSSNPAVIPIPEVIYTQGDTDGTLTFTPVPNANGSSTITITVDDGGEESNIKSVTFTVNVTPVNDMPTIDPIGNPSPILEDAIEQSISLLGISDGDQEVAQKVVISATSSNTALISNPTVEYTSGESNGALRYTPVANRNGTATITLTVRDDFGTSNGGQNEKVINFLVEVLPVNDAPTISEIPNPPIIRESAVPTQVVNLAGISDGDPNIAQNLTVTAVSSNKALVQEVEVVYTPNQTTGQLLFTPVPNVDGVTTITVTVTDDAGTNNGGVDFKTVSFEVTVDARNNPPTIDAISDQNIIEDSGPQTIRMRGIRDGDDGTQAISITAESSNPEIVPAPAVNYTDGDIEGTLVYQPEPGISGFTIITVTVQDDGGTEQGGVDTKQIQFEIAVLDVNDKPTIDQVSPITILEDAGGQSVELTGITDGDIDLEQELTITVTSSNPDLIPNPQLTYESPASEGTLEFAPLPQKNGVATITVTVVDDGGSEVTGQEDTRIMEFDVTVTPVNDAPKLSNVSDVMILEDDPTQTIKLTGISDGDPEIQQTLDSLVAFSSNPDLIPDPQIIYTAGNVDADLVFTPKPNANGLASITVRLVDRAGIENGGENTTSIQFRVEVTPLNDAPTIDDIGDQPEILKNSGEKTLTLTGISDGDPELEQTLSVTAVSSNPNIIPNPVLDYKAGSNTATLTYMPLPDARGEVNISITLKDNGGRVREQDRDTRVETFRVAVGLTNNPPVVRDDFGEPLEEIEISTPKDKPVDICFNVDDLDQDEIVFGEILVQPERGQITLQDDLCLTYEALSASLVGNDYFEITFCDVVEPESDVLCDTVRIDIIVDPAEQVKVYNGISPGFDGKNDRWIIEGIERFPGNIVQIYSKSGTLVYQADGYNNETVVWEGQSNTGISLGQRVLPKGVYYYVIDFGIGGDEQRNGYVILR